MSPKRPYGSPSLGAQNPPGHKVDWTPPGKPLPGLTTPLPSKTSKTSPNKGS
jgi:hypothetical protein